MLKKQCKFAHNYLLVVTKKSYIYMNRSTYFVYKKRICTYFFQVRNTYWLDPLSSGMGFEIFPFHADFVFKGRKTIVFATFAHPLDVLKFRIHFFERTKSGAGPSSRPEHDCYLLYCLYKKTGNRVINVLYLHFFVMVGLNSLC